MNIATYTGRECVIRALCIPYCNPHIILLSFAVWWAGSFIISFWRRDRGGSRGSGQRGNMLDTYTNDNAMKLVQLFVTWYLSEIHKGWVHKNNRHAAVAVRCCVFRSWGCSWNAIGRLREQIRSVLSI